MPKFEFIEASRGTPLTKTFNLDQGGNIVKDSYPMVKNVTTHAEVIETIEDLFEAITNHSALGHCLLKGQLDQPLINESRAGHTDPEIPTEWMVLDNDYLPDLKPHELMELLGFGDVDYILQYSSSAGIES